ncbi:type I-E CRISPR-associated protein Cse1/CasA [Oceanospirillum linum]|uniref:Type I-E CRISPR-associated protein Cse1/CasA n=1 Tax=Oceanospirillum linum TaxID=966 RepID=A0A1T1H8S6_OCELI|nr:type I-E CRISPR-associated protein Cse1/CasA [Oceanospirillum linum]OOV86274.1 type I-E CRISPR-associated protein Cse1/CasA [Oceanospirillum linum]SEG52528.1 CRISPR-associated protein, Cse1 family [Oleiphilus messinensis]SMP30526.1 CRISPR-associated protein, Cse1 family [Oceanospirillum linum]
MNLLTDSWIPVQQAGLQEKITFQQLLCGEKGGEICLPRDDMEFACLQLLVALTQVLFTPSDKKALVQRIKNPLTPEEYASGCEGKKDWFDLNHPETPFMQFRSVKAKEPTPMDKLMAGVADGTNKTFVNPQGLADGLCASCVSIALYNTAYNCPSAGGGFQPGMRGSTSITVLIATDSLRKTIWHNILTVESLNKEMPWYSQTSCMTPNYIDGLPPGAQYVFSEIGINRGLFWQPAKYQLCEPQPNLVCSCCGDTGRIYTGFLKEKLQPKYTISGAWPHPLSSRTFVIKKGGREEKFPSFTTTQPTWVHLPELVAEIQKDKEGYHPAPVIAQLRSYGANRLSFYVGGYRNGIKTTATIVERRHEMFSLADGWKDNSIVIDELIRNAQSYKNALSRALEDFYKLAIMSATSKKNRDRIKKIASQYSSVFYQQTENLIHDTLAHIDFDQPQDDLKSLYSDLKTVVIHLFNQATEPYKQEPKMLKALASSRRLLHQYLKELEAQGGNHEPAKSA